MPFVLDSTICFKFILLLSQISNPQTIEMWHRNRTVCYINDNQKRNGMDFKCHNVDDFSIEWKLPTPELFSGLASK